MQKTTFFMILALSGSISNAESLRPDVDKMYPQGVSGEPTVYTSKVVGNVIALGEAIYESVPVEKICYDKDQNVISSINYGTILGAVGGAVIGNQFGQGDGKTASTIAGALAGGYTGNKIYNQQMPSRDPNANCQLRFVQKLKGYPVTVQYDGIQMQGFSYGRAPRVGEQFEVIIKSFYFAGQSNELRKW